MMSETNKPPQIESVWFKTATLIGVAVLVVLLDQLTKYFANTQLPYNQAQTVFPGFDLLLSYNSGAAFSFLHDAGGWQRYFLTGISVVVSMVVLIWLVKLPKQQKLQCAALTLILGGAVGNLIDRAMQGYVIDFISVYFEQYRFATFNIADSAISVGAALILLEIILEMFKSKQAEDRAHD